MDSILEIRDLRKDFKGDFWKPKVQVLKGVSFDVPRGDVFGLIGPNGAGKTTTIKVLMGLVKPTSGRVRVLGQPVEDRRGKHLIGYLPENAYYYDYLRTEEVLDFYARLFGLTGAKKEKRVDELLELVGLSEKKGVLLRHFSKGMLQRIGIAQALVNDPQVVVLDEPMSGLDPIGRREIRDIILRLADAKKTILFSSHILPDVEAICEHIGIIIQGEMRAVGPMAELVQARVKSVEVTFKANTIADLPRPLQDTVQLRRAGDELILSLAAPGILQEVLDWGRAQNLSLISVAPRKETLEDLFMEKLGVRE